MPISNLVRCQGILAGARDSHPSLFEQKCPFIAFGHVLTLYQMGRLFDMSISNLVRCQGILAGARDSHPSLFLAKMSLHNIWTCFDI
jgi:hypothetical protein